MRIAVCDDEVTMLKLISSLVRSEFENRNENVVVSSYLKAEQLIRDFTSKSFDAVLLDIRMPDMDGFEAARLLRENNPEVRIVFITTEEGLVYDSFDFQPFAFIPKTPPDTMKSRLSHTMKNLISSLKSSRRICIELPYNDKIYVKPEELVYVNSEKNNLFYHLSNGETVITRSKIQEAEELLPTDIFVRIHNRTIVNMGHIKDMEYDHTSLTVDCGEELSISRTYKTDFDAAYVKWQRSHT